MTHSRFLNSTVILLALLSLLILAPLSIRAQEDDIGQLRQRIAELETRIKDLETQLEGCVGYLEKKNVDPGAWRNKKNWRKLEIGMLQVDVESLLGGPVKVIQGIRTLWYYPNMYCGYVSFDESGRLTGWSEP